jgi:hypothetical protein
VHAIAAPTSREKSLHYLQRFWERLPEHGQIVVFDRSWYGRVLVERVEGYATPMEWRRAYHEINDFERMLLEDDTRLVKIFLHITPEEQMHRFRARLTDPLKRWKLSYEATLFDSRSAMTRNAAILPNGLLLAGTRCQGARLVDVALEPRPLDPKVAEAAERLLGIRLLSGNHPNR